MASATATRPALHLGDKLTVTISEWLRAQHNLASRVLDGTLAAQTERAILVEGSASTARALSCHRCGREIVNPISQLVGYGPICSDYLGIPRPEALDTTQIEQIRKAVAQKTAFRQWFPKSSVTWTVTQSASADESFARHSQAFAEANNAFYAPRTTITEMVKVGPGTPYFIAPASLAVPLAPRPQVRFTVEGQTIYCSADFALKDTCKSVTGARWNPERKQWSYPATPSIAAEIDAAFTGTGTTRIADAAFDALLGHGQRLVEAIARAASAKTATDLPPIPATKLAPWLHQLRAYHFYKDLDAGLIAFDMGAGKSRVAIDLIVNRGHKRVLILCPNSVVGVWPKQFDLHAGAPLNVVPLLQESVAAKMTRAQSYKQQTAVFVINYESAWREPFASWALKQEWDCVIADEAHRIKQPGGKAALFVAALGRRAKTRLALTGTPMPHSPLDIYAQYRFLDPSIFGTSFVRFRARYAVMGGYGNHQVIQWQNQDELHAKMYSIAFRVTKDVLDLPPVQHITRTFELSPSARKVYRELADGFESDVAAGTVTISNALVRLLRLQQITSGYVQQDDTDEREGELVAVDDGKAALLADLLQDFAQTEPLVVFCRFQRDLDAVRKVAEEQGRRYGELSGRRKDGLTEYSEMRPDIDVVAFQIQAGSVGIDLTRARYAIYYSISFSLGDYEQSLARIDRPGQNHPVTYYHLQAEHTVDQKVYRALADRKDVVTAILDDIKKGR